MEASDQLHAPVALLAGKFPGTHFMGGLMDAEVGMDAVEERRNFRCSQESNFRSLVNQPLV
jgi:hypothetical protein